MRHQHTLPLRDVRPCGARSNCTLKNLLPCVIRTTSHGTISLLRAGENNRTGLEEMCELLCIGMFMQRPYIREDKLKLISTHKSRVKEVLGLLLGFANFLQGWELLQRCLHSISMSSFLLLEAFGALGVVSLLHQISVAASRDTSELFQSHFK